MYMTTKISYGLKKTSLFCLLNQGYLFNILLCEYTPAFYDVLPLPGPDFYFIVVYEANPS